VTHPYRDLIEQEVSRAEQDLSAFRSRALTVVTTSSGIVTLLTGIITFGASKVEEEKGIPDAAIVIIAIALALFVAAAVFALLANSPADIDRPSGPELARITTSAGWVEHKDEDGEQEREVAEVLVTYLTSLRQAGDTAACKLTTAIWLQIIGLGVAAAAGVVTMLCV
jgi:hypothetical protein